MVDTANLINAAGFFNTHQAQPTWGATNGRAFITPKFMKRYLFYKPSLLKQELSSLGSEQIRP